VFGFDVLIISVFTAGFGICSLLATIFRMRERL
jgi:hypothetical protein